MKTGKIVKVYTASLGGGTHGLTYSLATNTLWTAALSIQCAAEMDPKDNLRVLRMFRTPGERAHGLDVDANSLLDVVCDRPRGPPVRHQYRQGAGNHHDSRIRAGRAWTGSEGWLSLLLRLGTDGTGPRQRPGSGLQIQVDTARATN